MAATKMATQMSPENAGRLYGQLRDETLAKANEAKSIIRVAESEERDMTVDELAQVDSLMLQAEGLKARMSEVRVDMEGGTGHRSGFRTPIEEIRLFSTGSSPGGKARRGAEWGKAVVDACSDGLRFKGLTTAGTVLVTIPQPDPIALGRPVSSLRSLLHVEQTTGVYAYLQQTARTNNAAPVPPGGVKPESPSTLVRVQDHARVIAHLSEPIARQDLADAPLLVDFVTAELVWGLWQALENGVINGDGVGENLLGLANTPGVQTVARIDPTTDLGLIRTLRRSITMIESLGVEPTGFVMSPTDWESVEVSASETGGDLLLTNAGAAVPIDRAARRLYGLPVVPSPSCPPGTAYCADFTGSVTLYERESATIDWSEHVWRPDAVSPGVGASLFALNQVQFRCEGRWGFAVTRPSAVVKISLV